MRKLITAISLAMAGVIGFAGIAGATTPVVDTEAEVTSLFNTHAPVVVGVVILVAGFSITMAVLGGGIGKLRSALNARR